ncbi:hypothetical protein [Streptomyces sp. H34-S4]|uniref:hypothetical protein n=1 Tax=Streptomyces sp. H34-S4 TaxID=2996463 RepID=UPI002270AC65|nr:hypothetical protein [Streptomyces sp. H34-S4]MCY0939613.1 hypothetical protein [Streptomyces sp. H34-S4]
MRQCPECGATVCVHARFVSWCAACDWNVDPGAPDPDRGRLAAYRRVRRVLLMAVATLLPRPGRLPKGAPVLYRAHALRLFELIDEVGAAVGTTGVHAVAPDTAHNAWVGTYGMRNRRVMCLGAGLVSARRGHSVDDTHPPTHLRRRCLASAGPHPARVVCDASRTQSIAAEPAPARTRLARTVIRYNAD